ncbi:hypothetical protein Tco_0076288 [Tanacetum coccineum]
MFLNIDQLQKQLDNNEFQEIGSMASFKVLETQFQMFIKSKIYLNDEYIVMTRNYFFEYSSSSLGRQCQMASAENNTSGPAPFLNVQKTFDRSRSSLGLRGNDF